MGKEQAKNTKLGQSAPEDGIRENPAGRRPLLVVRLVHRRGSGTVRQGFRRGSPVRPKSQDNRQHRPYVLPKLQICRGLYDQKIFSGIKASLYWKSEEAGVEQVEALCVPRLVPLFTYFESRTPLTPVASGRGEAVPHPNQSHAGRGQVLRMAELRLWPFQTAVARTREKTFESPMFFPSQPAP